MNTLYVIKEENLEKISIDSWEQLEEKSPLVMRRSIIDGIKFFFSKELCTAEQIFILLSKHPEGIKIWNDIAYMGGYVQGYFISQIRDSFLQSNLLNDEKKERFGTFLNDPKRPLFE
jgi:hypothetical protein